MRRYRGILIAATAAIMLCACSGKSDGPAEETTKENTEATAGTESRQPEIQILEETVAATQPETSAQESPAESGGAAAGENAGQDIRGTEAAGTDAAGETEAAKAYPVEAFEKTMYATANVNVRVSYTTKSEVLSSLAPGQKVKVTGKSANGWIRVICDGRDAFVYQKYLSDSVPESGKPQPGTDPASPGNLEPAPDVTTYPGNPAEDPPKTPGQIPIVEPVPIMTPPGQGGSVTQTGPGM